MLSLCIFGALVLLSGKIFGQVGNRCVFKATGTMGVCTLSSECPEVEELAKNGVTATICGFHEQTTPIVCCERKFSYQPNDNTFLNVRPDTDESGADSNSESSYNGDKNQNNYNTNYGSQNNPDSIVYPDSIGSFSGNTNNNDRRRGQLANRKCEEYSKSITEVVQAIPLITNTEPIKIEVEKCDYNGVALIVGGKPANAGEFPFMALLGVLNEDTNQIEWKCGATLVSEQYVVTAAHCSYDRDWGKPKVVRLGELDFLSNKDNSVHADYDIDDIIVHSQYVPPLKYHDIALVRTKRRIRFTKFIRPACLYTKFNVDQTQAVATGWGKTDFTSFELSSRLMKVSLNVYENRQCQKTYRHDNKTLPRGIIDAMLCAGELKGGRDTCQGDSGGPLLITKKGNQCKFYIIGVVSFGKFCGAVSTPAVYTRISEYVDWIEKQIW